MKKMKKSELRLLIRLSIRLHNASTNRRSRRLVKLSPAMRGYAGDDDGFIDDDTLLNLIIPRAIKYAIHAAIQYNDKIYDRLILSINLLLAEYGISSWTLVMDDNELNAALLQFGEDLIG